MGNTPSIEETNRKTEQDFKHAFSEEVWNPQKNGVAEQFDLNNSNGFMGKTKDAFDEGFKKGGVGNQILRKSGEVAHTIGDIADIGGDIALQVGGALVPIAPELALPIVEAGGLLKTGAPVVRKIGDISEKTADTIEKDKKDLRPAKDIPAIFR